MYVTYPHPVDKEIKQNFFEEVDKKVLVLAFAIPKAFFRGIKLDLVKSERRYHSLRGFSC